VSIKKSPAFASATQPSSADELMGRLAAYRPVETREFETKLAPTGATIAQVVLIGENGEAEDLGERPLFWVVVRRQLATATPRSRGSSGGLSSPGRPTACRR